MSSIILTFLRNLGDLFCFVLCRRAFCLHVCKCTMCAWYLKRPERASDPLELELQLFVSCVVAGDEVCQEEQPVLSTSEPSLQPHRSPCLRLEINYNIIREVRERQRQQDVQPGVHSTTKCPIPSSTVTLVRVSTMCSSHAAMGV